MAHFAKIENNKVTAVIVAEQPFIDTLPGKWVQTSYNSCGNVHYGPDGQPDGGEALRANYAGIGYTYDHILDVFYAPRPSALHRLNPVTYLWELDPSYEPIAVVEIISDTSTLPVVTNDLCEGVPLTDTSLVLFTSLSAGAGVYKYSTSSKTFEIVDENYKAAIMRTDFSKTYNMQGEKWTLLVAR